MSPVKTPTSSLTAIELLGYKAWYRSKATLKQPFNGRAPRLAFSPSPSRARILLPDLVDQIISCLFYDLEALKACSMTCYSWYILTLPHLYYYLTTDNEMEPQDRWSKPLWRSGKSQLLPFVRQLCIRNTLDFIPEKSTFHYFSAFTNLRELGIDGLQVSSFMQDIEQCFKHFALTLRFLALKDPKGSSRQILYLIGLFPNLQDLKLCYRSPIEQEEDLSDPTLVPPSIPPLCGRLTLTCFTREELVKDMITLFGGFRFRSMDLFRVKCVRLLLSACAETLETLRLYPTDPYVNNEAVRLHFNLSMNKSLRTLETTAISITNAGDSASGFLKTVLSTIPPSISLQVVVIHHMGSGVGWYGWDRKTGVQAGPQCAREEVAGNRKHSERFMVFREMYNERKFQLVLFADVHARAQEHATTMLKGIVEATGKQEGFESLLSGTSVTCDRHLPHIRYRGSSTGAEGSLPIHLSAL